jgi:hypothetical protein
MWSAWISQETMLSIHPSAVPNANPLAIAIPVRLSTTPEAETFMLVVPDHPKKTTPLDANPQAGSTPFALCLSRFWTNINFRRRNPVLFSWLRCVRPDFREWDSVKPYGPLDATEPGLTNTVRDDDTLIGDCIFVYDNGPVVSILEQGPIRWSV